MSQNVRSYNIIGDGNADNTDNLHKVINAISTDPNNADTCYNNKIITKSALIYILREMYKLIKTLDLQLNTILVKDPFHRLVFKTSAKFDSNSLINGNDFVTNEAFDITNFFITIKNIVIDTTAINKDIAVITLRWGITQAYQLTNININMPTNSERYIGIDLNQESAISV